MYPLQHEFVVPIKSVINKLNSYKDLQVNTFITATTLVGDYDIVMNAIKETLAWSYEEHGTAVFVTKLIPGYEPGL